VSQICLRVVTSPSAASPNSLIANEFVRAVQGRPPSVAPAGLHSTDFQHGALRWLEHREQGDGGLGSSDGQMPAGALFAFVERPFINVFLDYSRVAA
jgi:hypothetical protein